MSSGSTRFPLPPVPQSPITPTASNWKDMDGSVELQTQNAGRAAIDNQGQEALDGDNAMSTALTPKLRHSTSQSRLISDRSSLVSRVSTIFTPRKKLTSFSVAGGSSVGYSGEPITAEATALVEDIPPATSPATDYTAGGITRKGFEPVGHIAKSPRKRRSILDLGRFPSSNKTGGRKEGQMLSTSLFPASGNALSSSSVSLAMRKSSQSRSKQKRRASVSAGDGWLVGSGAEDDDEIDEIDEIRRPSDLGPEAEIMGEELDWDGATEVRKEKPLPDLPMGEEDPCFLWTSIRPTSPRSTTTSPVMQAISNSQIITHTLHFLPKRSEVAQLATVSRVFLVAARRVLYGCVDLRSSIDTNSQTEYGVDNKQVRKKKRKALGKTLECLVGYSLQERNGELFQDTWGFLMDEWPFGWFESDEIGGANDKTNSGHDDDAESQHTAYSDSEFTSNSPTVFQLSFSDVPHQIDRRHSTTSLRSSTLSQRRSVHRQQRRQRFHTLLKTLLASVPALTTLMLPAFELGILKYHTAFGLREVTFLNRRMADWEREGMLGWLDGIVGVLEVRLPRLIEGDGDAEEETAVDDEEAFGKNEDVDNADNQDLVVGVEVNVEPPAERQREGLDSSNSDDSVFPPRKKKRKTLLTISPSSDSPVPSSPPVPNFPLPPMSPTTLSTPTTSRPISMLFPYLSPPSPATQSPPSSSTSTPRQHGTLTPEPAGSHTSSPLTPLTPMTPVTPFTPGFYLHSSSSSALIMNSSTKTERRIHELGKRETLLPTLEVLHGPPSLVELLIPRRRKTVREVRINLHGTIDGGQVKVAQIVKGLVRRSKSRVDGIGLEIDTKGVKEMVQEEETGMCDEGRIQTLAFHFTRSVDRRTMETVLASAGAAICGGESRGERRGGNKDVDYRQHQGVNTLEVIAACTGHPNSRKSDEAMYKIIHTILPRYRSLRTLVMRLADPETGEFLHITVPATRHNRLSLASLSSSQHGEGVPDITHPITSAETIDTPQIMIHTPLTPSGNGYNSLQAEDTKEAPHQSSTLNGLASPTDQVTSVLTFPRMASPPPADVGSPVLSAGGSIRSLEMQKLRDRKMMRRFGSVSQRSDSLASASSFSCQPRSILTSISPRTPQESRSLNGEHGHRDDDDDTIHSSSISPKSKSVSSFGRSLKRAGNVRESILSLKKLQNFQGLSIVTATKAMAQVVSTRATNTFRTRSAVGSDYMNIDANEYASNYRPASPTTPMGKGIATPMVVKPLSVELGLASKGRENETEDVPGIGNGTPPSVPTSPSPDVSTTANDSSMSVLTSSQRRHIRTWGKQCSSLSRVLFLNGAVWERDLVRL